MNQNGGEEDNSNCFCSYNSCDFLAIFGSIPAKLADFMEEAAIDAISCCLSTSPYFFQFKMMKHNFATTRSCTSNHCF